MRKASDIEPPVAGATPAAPTVEASPASGAPRAARPPRSLRSQPGKLALYHLLLLGGIVAFWYVMTEPGLIPTFYFDEPTRAKFFFGQPIEVGKRIWNWFAGGSIWLHLGVTLLETVLAFAIGTLLGLATGLWLALSPSASTIADPYIKAMNAMPRVILAPIFAVWFGLGITSKVVFGVTLVFFIVFFNVYQGVKEVSPVVLANARMLGASGRQLLRYVYLPSATSWVFSSLHTSVGLAFVGAVVGEYLGSARGVGYLIHQAEGVFDIDTVLAGILVLTVFALILDFIVTRIENRLLVWRPRVAETEAL
jgi:NitT/TauT family transport system permease protein